MTIPRRPDPKDYRDDFGFGELRRARQAHEHAVAVRAVEALRRIKAYDDEGRGRVDACGNCARNALREIDESGWKP